MKCTIQIIYDNGKGEEGFQEGWGFSCFVDLGERKILFDTGADAKAFFSNLQHLGIRLDEVTDVVYSHKHFDHVAGCREVLLNLKPGACVFVPKGFPLRKIPSTVSVRIVEDFQKIDTAIYSLVLKGGFFLYEQMLLIETEKGLVVITGCAHPGIVSILQEATRRLKQPIYLVLGGFHLFRKKKRQVDTIVEQFKDLHVQIAAPCHCSGATALKQFQQVFQDRYYPIWTGKVLTLDLKKARL